MAAFTLNFDPTQLPDYSTLTPAQQASIAQILIAKGILPSGYNPKVYSGPCDPAYLATIPATNQGYAASLCSQGIAGFNIGTGLANYNLDQVKTGIAQLPSSVSSISDVAIQPVSDAVNSVVGALKGISSVPAWMWVAGGALVIVLLASALR